MFSKIISSERSAIGAQIRKFGRLTLSRPPLFPPHTQLIFLCGANRAPGTPSARRQEIKKFIESQSSNHKVIYAESVFNELLKLGGNKNSLDLEHEISKIADKVLIILESPSTFCELGAFSHEGLRGNLIIINDKKFKLEDSFINTGPIAAIEEAKGPVLWYPMSTNDPSVLDGIGAVFSDIKKSLDKGSSRRSRRINDDLTTLGPNKASLYFVHDIIYLTEPIDYKEIISVLKVAFGDKDYGVLKRLLGILKAADLIESGDNDGRFIYRSKVRKTLLSHNADVDRLMSTFRGFHLRTNPSRFEK